MKHSLLLLFVTLAPLALGQGLRIPESIEKLGQKATETVDVTLDQTMLQFAQKLAGDSDSEAKRVLGGLRGIRVRSFEFDNEGAYSTADVEAMRKQLATPAWSKIAQVQSKRERENVDVFLRLGANEISGLVVMVAGPKELTIVDIDGTIKPEDLRHVSGRAGIPALDLRVGEKAKK